MSASSWPRGTHVQCLDSASFNQPNHVSGSDFEASSYLLHFQYDPTLIESQAGWDGELRRWGWGRCLGWPQWLGYLEVLSLERFHCHCFPSMKFNVVTVLTVN